MEPNAFYIGSLRACLGRNPDAQDEPELFELKGIRGFAYESADSRDIWIFHIDGYPFSHDQYSFRVKKSNIRSL